jgi:Ca2+-dependent lipid-binding protein
LCQSNGRDSRVSHSSFSIPQDMGVNEFSDPFVGIVFEDTMVRTDVIHDSNNPRWMPWCTRAFCFNVQHPTSLLMLGVFDYDSTPIKDHDPVGRVVINMANFQSHTSYLLHYALHDDPQQEDVR